MSAPDTIWRSRCGCLPTCNEVEYSEGDDRPRRYGTERVDDDAVEYARVTASVRLARWLDADPARTIDVYLSHYGTYMADLYTGGRGTMHGERIRGIGDDRDEALSAALDQAEGVQDAD